MNRHFRLAAALTTCCALLAAAAAGWACPGGAGQDLADLPGLLRQISEGHQRREELERRAGQVASRLAEKEAVAADLLEGRLSLAEAAERFRALNALDPAAVEATRATYPSSSDEEAACRQALAWARARLEEYPPGRGAEAGERLERQAEELLGGP